MPPDVASPSLNPPHHLPGAGYQVFVVDAFTAEPFSGNPAGVVPLPAEAPPPPDDWMRRAAAEMKHAETAFFRPRPEPGHFDLRWFTPEAEVDLCGHATLAAAHVVFSAHPNFHAATFHTRSGPLTCRRAQTDGLIEMDFPALHVTPDDPPADLLGALGLHQVRFVGKSLFDYLVVVDSAEEVLRVAPDFRRLRAIKTRGVIVAARGDPASATGGPASGFDVVSRFFGPAVGIDEDPVTGSAHCVLAPYFSAQTAKPRLTCRQLSSRGGTVHTELRPGRVVLSGQAITVLAGVIRAS